MRFSQELVSVIIPLYNHAPFIEACIDSVVSQTYSKIELILVDDHSCDGGFERARDHLTRHEMRFVRTVIVQNTRNRGAPFSLNRAIALAKGTTLAFLNSDDLFEPDRLTTLLASMDQTGSRWAFSSVLPIGEDGAPFWGDSKAHKFSTEPTQLCQSLPAPSWALLHFQACISTGNIVVDRQLALDVGGFSSLRYCHDWAFVLACAWHHEPAFVDAPLYKYRFHSSNSFSGLSHVANRDSAFVLRAHCLRTATGIAPNPSHPGPNFGSVLYETIANELGISGLNTSIFNPYKPFHRTVVQDRG